MLSSTRSVAIQSHGFVLNRASASVPSLFAPRFSRSLRPSPDPVSVVCALIDNAWDARARTVDVLVSSRDGRVVSIAVVDDGVGMVPEMIQAACAAGESCRLGDGPHFARSGSGLPTRPLAIGRRFTVFSRTRGFPTHAVVQTGCGKQARPLPAPAAMQARLPRFLEEKTAAWAAAPSGTIVLIECLMDSFLDARSLRRKLRQKVAFAFGRLQHKAGISVDGRALDFGDRLAEVGPEFFICGDDDAVHVTSAFCAAGGRAHSHAQRAAPSKAMTSTPGRGLIGVRIGRRIGAVRDCPLWRPTSDDRNWRIEIDYPVEFDPDFRPNVNLDALEISDAMWARLEAGGLLTLIETLRDAAR